MVRSTKQQLIMTHPKYDNSTVNGSSSNTEENYGMPSFSLIPTKMIYLFQYTAVSRRQYC